MPWAFCLWSCIHLFLLGGRANGQEIEPRRWSHLPIGSNTATGGLAVTTGDIFLNPVLRIEDAEFELDTVALRYVRSFEMFGKSARVDVFGGWQSGYWKGLLDGVPARVEREGWMDSTVRLAVNLMGAPPLEGKEFAEYRAHIENETIVGAALAVQLPTGEYMEDKLINLGDNTFTFLPQLGVVHTHGKWSAEFTASGAFHTDNHSYFNGRTLEVSPLLFMQGHFVYNFRPGLWIAASAGYGCGAESTIDGASSNDRKEFVGWGISLGIPITRNLGFKAGYIGTRTLADTGADTDTVTAGFGITW